MVVHAVHIGCLGFCSYTAAPDVVLVGGSAGQPEGMAICYQPSSHAPQRAAANMPGIPVCMSVTAKQKPQARPGSTEAGAAVRLMQLRQ
jgi:hypothetical protein